MNEAAVGLYLRSGTCWKRNPMNGVREGLDYPQLESLLRLCGADLPPEDFGRLQVLEDETVRIDREEAGKPRQDHPHTRPLEGNLRAGR